jgi:hypothetical protein
MLMSLKKQILYTIIIEKGLTKNSFLLMKMIILISETKTEPKSNVEVELTDTLSTTLVHIKSLVTDM